MDTIGPRLLKLAAPYISESLTFICNQSIVKSVFPKKRKEGKVTPLHKNGAKDDTNNYRPISVLPVVSKLLEKHVHDFSDGLFFFKQSITFNSVRFPA